jgi:hypothetical protein
MEESKTAEAAAARQQVVACIRQRVNANVGSWLGADECVQISLACATRDCKDVLQMLFSKQVSEKAFANRSKLEIVEDEWKVLFGADAIVTRQSNLSASLTDASFTDSINRLSSVLRCTIAEPTQGKAWARPWVKSVCFLAMHLEQNEDYIAASLGNIVRADSRRLEDFRAHLEDEGCDILVVAHVIETVSRTVT